MENPVRQAQRRKWPNKVTMIWAKSSPLHAQFLCTCVFIIARRLREIWLFSFALFYRQIKSSTSITSKKYQRKKEEMPPWRYFVGSHRRQRLFFSKLDSCTEQYRWILISSIGTGMTAFLRLESWSESKNWTKGEGKGKRGNVKSPLPSPSSLFLSSQLSRPTRAETHATQA